MKRPASITAIGSIFIIAGSLSGVEIIYDLFHGKLNLNFAVLMLPVGIGLMKGKASSRTWARVWIGLFVAIAALLLAAYPFMGDQYSVTWYAGQLQGVERHLAITGLSLLFIIPGVIMWRLLSSANAAHFFDDHTKPQADTERHQE